MELAQRMFEAYNAAGPNPNKTWDGKDVPAWADVGPQVTAKWRAAAEAAGGIAGPPHAARLQHEGNLLIDTLEALLAEPTLGNQTERLKQALSYARLQAKVADELTSAMLIAEDKLQNKLLLDSDELQLKAFAINCHSNAVAHGWWDEEKVGRRTFGDVIALLHSEVSEALEAFRMPGDLKTRLFHMAIDEAGQPKPEGILSEFADVVIRVLDYTESIKATEQFVIALKLKHEYNVGRPYRHGGKQL